MREQNSNMDRHQAAISGGVFDELSFSRAKGAYCYDLSDRPYLDMVSGYGSVILGHGDGEVADAVASILHGGTYLYGRHSSVAILSELFRNLYKNTSNIYFHKTGSEAVQSATRIARAETGKPKLLRCGFHGWHDQFIYDDISWHRYSIDAESREDVDGVPDFFGSVVTSVAFDIERIREIIETSSDLAAFIIDPVQIVDPEKNFMLLQNICAKNNILFIVDESKTAMRVAPGGVQELYNFQADITILSKAIANGFPLAATLCSDRLTKPKENLKIMGTFNHEIVALTASIIVTNKIDKDDICKKIDLTGQMMIDEMNGALASRGYSKLVEMLPYKWPSMPFLCWRSNSEALEFAHRLKKRNVLWLPKHMNFINACHTKNEIDIFVKAALETIDEMIEVRNAVD